MTTGRSLDDLLRELNLYRDTLGMRPLTKEAIPSGSAGFDFLDSQIEQARNQWQSNLPWWQQALAGFGLGGPTAQPAQLAPGVAEKAAGFDPEAAAAEAARVEADAVSLGVDVPDFPTEPPPEGFRWAFDRELNRWVPQFTGLTAQQQSQQELQQRQLELQEQQQAGFPAPTAEPPTDAFGRPATWNPRTGQWSYPPTFGQRPLDQPTPISPFQQQQLGFQEQQLAQGQQQFQQQLQFQQSQMQASQAEQERQYLSQLAANPINWLQYAAYTGEQPVIQPWMVPLGFQNTGGNIAPQGQPQAGQPLPGFQGQGQGFSGLPQLTTPSAQLQARWGPTAQAQFLGYRQARTGASPEESQFRLGSGRAPTGAFRGFSSFR
ncbi:hypothetical protein LCGC14_1780940 [marine sediment metagenome]|uniref:Uncharacterized protein n=1 Tax=marine sediment metagenome TaxID=412755 RepID=A0A0F9JV30_9ZZZZ